MTSSTSAPSSSCATCVVLTPKQAIFYSAELLLKKVVAGNTTSSTLRIAVRGMIVWLDLERHRMDIAEAGGKLIVRWNGPIDASLLKEGVVVQVTGLLKKEQRHTFLEAVDVVVVGGIPSLE